MVENNYGIRVCLSRRQYSTETSVIGSVIVPSELELSTLKIYLAGRCRLDSRWHDIQSVKKYYGTHPCHDVLPDWVEKVAEETYFMNMAKRKSDSVAASRSSKIVNNESICFWSTNVLTLYDHGLQVPLVNTNSGDHVGPENENDHEPLSMSGSEWFHRASRFLEILQGNDNFHDDDDEEEEEEEEEENESSEISSSSVSNLSSDIASDSVVGDDESTSNSCHVGTSRSNNGHQDSGEIAYPRKYFTFRSDLPADINPTVNATSVRYYYSVVVYALFEDGEVSCSVINLLECSLYELVVQISSDIPFKYLNHLFHLGLCIVCSCASAIYGGFIGTECV